MKFTQLLAGYCAGMLLFACSCTKQDTPKTTTSAIASIPKDSVLTPFGMRGKNDVHQIKEGHELAYQGNRLLEIESNTHRLVEDFGEQKPLKGGASVTSSFGRQATPTPPALGSGWIVYGSDNASVAYGGFVTDWKVPSNPPAYHSQLVYLFNGLQDGFTSTSHILQPVLQFGPNGAWGGNYWTIDNWYAGCGTCTAYYGTAITVASGTLLEGTMKQTAAYGSGTYSYNSKFTYLTGSAPPYTVHNYAASNQVSVSNVAQMRYAFETLEAYNMTVSNDYPNGSCNFFNATSYIQTGTSTTTPHTFTWTANNVVTDVGQHTTVVSPTEVDLYFH